MLTRSTVKAPASKYKAARKQIKGLDEDEEATNTPAAFRESRTTIIASLREGALDKDMRDMIRKTVYDGTKGDKELQRNVLDAYLELMQREKVPSFPLSVLKVALLLEQEAERQKPCADTLDIITTLDDLRSLSLRSKPRDVTTSYRSYTQNALLRRYLVEASSRPLNADLSNLMVAFAQTEKDELGFITTADGFAAEVTRIRTFLQSETAASELIHVCQARLDFWTASLAATSTHRARQKAYIAWAQKQRISPLPVTHFRAALHMYDYISTHKPAASTMGAARNAFLRLMRLCTEPSFDDIIEPTCPPLWAAIISSASSTNTAGIEEVGSEQAESPAAESTGMGPAKRLSPLLQTIIYDPDGHAQAGFLPPIYAGSGHPMAVSSSGSHSSLATPAPLPPSLHESLHTHGTQGFYSPPGRSVPLHVIESYLGLPPSNMGEASFEPPHDVEDLIQPPHNYLDIFAAHAFASPPAFRPQSPHHDMSLHFDEHW